MFWIVLVDVRMPNDTSRDLLEKHDDVFTCRMVCER